jgi:large subunit ribosomal protein L5e
MTFVKVLKNKAYFKRYQVKYRRRREGKTDYKARRKMIRQDKNKYNNRKYRIVVRFTNRKVICQILYATIRGDMVVEQATSTELPKFGVPVGHKNYAAAYCTGLIVARRMLKKFGLDETFKGKEEIDGEDYHVEEEEEEGDKRPLKVILDVGLQTTCVGHRMWGALKGAVDGGLHIPHSNKLFPGFKPAEDKGAEAEYDAEAHKEKIFSSNVKEYMEMMQEEDPTKYEAHFSKYIEHGIDADGIEDMYSEAHSKIKADPSFTPGEKKSVTYKREGNNKHVGSDGTEHKRSKKIGLEARRAKVQAKIAAAQAKMMEDDD